MDGKHILQSRKLKWTFRAQCWDQNKDQLYFYILPFTKRIVQCFLLKALSTTLFSSKKYIFQSFPIYIRLTNCIRKINWQYNGSDIGKPLHAFMQSYFKFHSFQFNWWVSFNQKFCDAFNVISIMDVMPSMPVIIQ